MQKIKIEKAIFGGSFLGKIDGKATFVPFALVDEICDIKITKNQKDYSLAEIISIENQSKDRIEPQCENFKTCGGCDYLHTTYENEIAIKTDIICDNLKRMAKIDIDKNNIKIIKADRFNYRTHASIKQKNGMFGFFAKTSNTLVPFPKNGCLLLDNSINDALKEIKDKRSEFKIASSKTEYNDTKIFTKENEEIEETENNIKYFRSIDSFFQGNKNLRSKMLNEVLFLAETNIENALDIGCGCGFFTIPIANKAKNVYGIDISEKSIKNAKRNAKENNKNNISFILGDMSKIDELNKNFDLIIADPPRSGLNKATRDAIIKKCSKKLIYVSCETSSFARDTKEFIANGFNLNTITFIDMFPATKHIELITSFSKN